MVILMYSIMGRNNGTLKAPNIHGFEYIGGLTNSSMQYNLCNKKMARVAVIDNVDTREVNPSCIDVHKQGESTAVIVNTDIREVNPSCINVHI